MVKLKNTMSLLKSTDDLETYFFTDLKVITKEMGTGLDGELDDHRPETFILEG